MLIWFITDENVFPKIQIENWNVDDIVYFLL